MNAIIFLLLNQNSQQRAQCYERRALPIIQSAHYSFAPSGEIITDLEDIDHSLSNVFNTEIGSDILHHNFGCNWIQHIDKPIDMATIYIIRELMIASRKWEPRVEIIKIDPRIDSSIHIGQVFFHTRYHLNPKIAGELRGYEHQTTIEGIIHER